MNVIGTIGIDLGGSNAVIAATKKTGVEIITNEASHRETPVVIGFGEHERFIGEQGYVQLKSNFKNTIVFPNRFLGITADAPFFNEEKKWLYNTISITPDNKPVFEVTYQGQKQRFLPEQLVAMMLQKIKKIVSKEGINQDGMVISVPSYYTEQERKALLDAADIAQINVLKLMNESTAIGLGYGIFRRSQLTLAPRNVCFVDLGHCSASAFVASFTKEKMHILNQVHERNLGTRDFDWKLLEFYAKMIMEKYDSDIIKKDKTRLRLLDAIEKQRKVLSANSDAPINVDCIVENDDLSYTLTRDKFEEIIVPIVEKFRSMLLKLKSELKYPLHSVEIIGGGTRIPFIQKVIQEVFGLECSRTLNASECIARGCAIEAAMLSPSFKVAPYQIEEANYYPIKCTWIFKKNGGGMEIETDSRNDPKKQSAIIFPTGCPIPCAKALTFHKDTNIDLSISYAEPVPEGANPLLARYIVKNKEQHEQGFEIKVRVALNPNGIVEFDHAQLLEETYEDILAEGGNAQNIKNKLGDKFSSPNTSKRRSSPMNWSPQQQEEEVRRKKKMVATNLNVDILTINNLDKELITKLVSEEVQMNYQDQIVQETHEKKNELESYVYDIRGKLNDKYDKYISSSTKADLLHKLDQLESWLYQEGAKASKSDYETKLEALKAEIRTIETAVAK